MTLNQPEAEEAKVGKGNKRRETMAQKKDKKVENPEKKAPKAKRAEKLGGNFHKLAAQKKPPVSSKSIGACKMPNIVLPKVKKVFPKIVKVSIELTDGKWLSKVFIEKEGSIKRSKLSFDGKLSPKEAIDKLMAMV